VWRPDALWSGVADDAAAGVQCAGFAGLATLSDLMIPMQCVSYGKKLKKKKHVVKVWQADRKHPGPVTCEGCCPLTAPLSMGFAAKHFVEEKPP
jgi:hypothetical protein